MQIRRRLTLTLLLLATSIAGASPATAGVLLEPYAAPDWHVAEWINGDPGSLKSLRGKIVLIEFFQLWCPGCNNFSIPLFLEWDQKYADRDDLVIVSIHSVFEGHDVQTPSRLRQFIEDWGIEHPVGIDSYRKTEDLVPTTMREFAASGTPHVMIVDRAGNVRFSAFGAFDPGPAEYFIDRLLEGTDKSAAASEPLPFPIEPVDERLSGSYRFRFEQTDRSCGPLLPAMEATAELTVYSDRIQLTSEQRYFEVDELALFYDPLSRRFHARTRRRGDQNGQTLTVSLELNGEFIGALNLPELAFEVKVVRQGDDPGPECEIEGVGRGVRTAPRAR